MYNHFKSIKWSPIRPSFEMCQKCYEKCGLDVFRFSLNGLSCLQLWHPIENNDGYAVYDVHSNCLSICFLDGRQSIEEFNDGSFYIPGVGEIISFETFFKIVRKSKLECYINEGNCPYYLEHVVLGEKNP